MRSTRRKSARGKQPSKVLPAQKPRGTLFARRKATMRPLDLRARKAARRRRKIFILLSVTLILVSAFAALFWFLLRTERFVISAVHVRGAHGESGAEIRELVFSHLHKREDAFFSSANTLLAPLYEIARAIEEAHPRIKTARILRKGFTEIIVVVEERNPFALYCEENVSIENNRSSGNCFFADEEGIIFRTAPYLAHPEIKLIYFSPDILKDGIRTAPLSRDELDAIGELGAALRREEIEPKSFHVTGGDTLHIMTGEGYSLLVLIDDDYSDEFGRFLSVLESDALRGGVLERIYQFDLRFGRKIFYRYRD